MSDGRSWFEVYNRGAHVQNCSVSEEADECVALLLRSGASIDDIMVEEHVETCRELSVVQFRREYGASSMPVVHVVQLTTTDEQFYRWMFTDGKEQTIAHLDWLIQNGNDIDAIHVEEWTGVSTWSEWSARRFMGREG